MKIETVETEVEGLASLVRQYQKMTGSTIVVYTSMTNSIDTLPAPSELRNKKVDFVCFTDLGNDIINGWKNFTIDFTYRDPRRLAKIFKVLPHRFLEAYEYSIWIDANLESKACVSDLIDSTMTSGYNINFFKHTTRECAYQEAAYCIKWGKDEKHIIEKQVKGYKTVGYPQNLGLIQGGVIMRFHKEQEVKALMEKWWCEIDNNSVRDQLSLNYCSWLTKIPISLIGDKDINDFFEIKPHKKYLVFGGSFGQNMRFLCGWFMYRIGFIKKTIKKLSISRKS